MSYHYRAYEKAAKLYAACHGNLTHEEFHSQKWEAVRDALYYVIHEDAPDPEVIRRGERKETP